jgi:hypothetical protein
LNLNNKQLNLESHIKTGFIQCFNSLEKVPCYNNCYVAVSDEGLFYVIERVSEFEKSKETINELAEIMKETKKENLFEDLYENETMTIEENDIKMDNQIKTSGNKFSNNKKKPNLNKFSPY